MCFSKIGNKLKLSTVTTPIQYSAGSSSQCNKAVEKHTSTQIENQEIKLFLFADDLIVCTGNYKEPIQKNIKLLKLMSEFSKVKRYKSNGKIIYLNSNNEHMESEVKNIIPFIIAPKKME